MLTSLPWLDRLPGGALNSLRAIRTALYWMAGPVDAACGEARDRAALPPLWLRRHTGPVAHFVSSARETVGWIERLALLERGDLVLDVGCGPGAMADALTDRLGPSGRYIGFDVHRPSITWCKKQFAHDPRYRFELAEVSSAYGTQRALSAEHYEFPLRDGTAGLVLAKSIFTHLLPPEAKHYLAETRRCLAPGRSALLTAFLFDGTRGGEAAAAFPFSENDAGTRWRLKNRPHSAVAYERGSFEAMLQQVGLVTDLLIPGYFPGTAWPPGGQDILIASRAGGR